MATSLLSWSDTVAANNEGSTTLLSESCTHIFMSNNEGVLFLLEWSPRFDFSP